MSLMICFTRTTKKIRLSFFGFLQLKFFNFFLDNIHCVEFDQYEPILGVLQQIFVPSIDKRIAALLGHFYKRDANDESILPKEGLACAILKWIEETPTVNSYLTRHGLAKVFIDSILVRNRLDRVARELDRLGLPRVNIPIDMSKICGTPNPT